MIHTYKAKSWKTPIDDPDYFEVEVLLFCQDQLLCVLKDQRSQQKYLFQVKDKVHLRYILQHFRFSIWKSPEWNKIVQDEFSCAVLEDSNFQKCLIDSKSMLNHLLVCEIEILEILTKSNVMISEVNDINIDIHIAEFLQKRKINTQKNILKTKNMCMQKKKGSRNIKA